MFPELMLVLLSPELSASVAIDLGINSHQNGTPKRSFDPPPVIEQHRSVGRPAGDGRICRML